MLLWLALRPSFKYFLLTQFFSSIISFNASTKNFYFKIELPFCWPSYLAFPPPQLTRDSSVFRNPHVTYFLVKLPRWKFAKYFISAKQNESDQVIFFPIFCRMFPFATHDTEQEGYEKYFPLSPFLILSLSPPSFHSLHFLLHFFLFSWKKFLNR